MQTQQEFQEKYENPIAINIGATTCAVAAYLNGKVEVIPNELGHHSTPCYVCFHENEVLFGDAAKFQARASPRNAVWGFSTMLAKSFDDPQVQTFMKYATFQVVSKDNKPVVVINDRDKQNTFTMEEITGLMLNYLRKLAENYLGKKVTKAVVTMSARYTQATRQALNHAAKNVNLDIVRLVSQSAAAALGFSMNFVKEEEDRTVLFYAFSGGCVTTTLAAVDKEVVDVRAIHVNQHMGGEFLDNILVDHFTKEIKTHLALDISTNPSALIKLRRACEVAKKNLSSATIANLVVENLTPGVNYATNFTREQFEKLCASQWSLLTEPAKKLLADSQVDPSAVTDLVLIGGSCKIPIIKKTLNEFLPVPATKHMILPDLFIIGGAAIQAAILSSQSSMLLVDVCPTSIGIETVGGAMTKIVPRNTTIPCLKSMDFTTCKDDQSCAQLWLYEGEHPYTKDNAPLAAVELKGLFRARKGVSTIKVQISVHVDGSLQLEAYDDSTLHKVTVNIPQDISSLPLVTPNPEYSLRLKVETLK